MGGQQDEQGRVKNILIIFLDSSSKFTRITRVGGRELTYFISLARVKKKFSFFPESGNILRDSNDTHTHPACDTSPIRK